MPPKPKPTLALRLSLAVLRRLLAATAAPTADHGRGGDHGDAVALHRLAEDLAGAQRLANALDQLARVHGHLFERPRPVPARGLEAEVAHPGLIPAQVVGQLVAHGALDLRPEQLGIVAEVALQGVLVDDDAVWIGVAGDGAADV